MNIRKLLVLMGCTVLLCGCTKSNIVQPEVADETIVGESPDMEIKDDVVLDWSQIGNEMDELFTDQSAYPMSLSVNYSLDEANKLFMLTLMVKESTDAEEACTYAEEVIKGLNDVIAQQDFSVERSSIESFGGFFEIYDLKLLVIPDNPYKSSDQYLVDQVVPAGEYQQIVPKKAE